MVVTMRPIARTVIRGRGDDRHTRLDIDRRWRHGHTPSQARERDNCDGDSQYVTHGDSNHKVSHKSTNALDWLLTDAAL